MPVLSNVPKMVECDFVDLVPSSSEPASCPPSPPASLQSSASIQAAPSVSPATAMLPKACGKACQTLPRSIANKNNPKPSCCNKENFKHVSSAMNKAPLRMSDKQIKKMATKSSSLPDKPGSIVKSENDSRKYSIISLPNGLEAVLISDPDTEVAAAALDVHCGSFNDPDDISGLAHFLEHLLFMGTKKYPDENEYNSFLSMHGGSSNAWTAEEHTNYHFDISADHLDGALDRFAQFFIAPLFDSSSVERERNAVDSEHAKNLNSDPHRFHRLSKALSDPKHPFSKFGCGNLETLGDLPKVLPALHDFHKRFYSANIMKLAVLGKQTLDYLENLVTELFTPVERNNSAVAPSWPPNPFTPAQLGIVIKAEALTPLRSLLLTWQVPYTNDYASKPDGYTSHLIGNESTGSILSYLKTKGWASGLSTWYSAPGTGVALFNVEISLSEDGLRHYKNGVIRAVFQYIQMLKNARAQAWIVEEYQKIALMNFKFLEKQEPLNYAVSLAEHMHTYSHEELLTGPMLISRIDLGAAEAFYSTLRTNNFRACLFTQKTGIPEDKLLKEKFFGTRYFVEPLGEDFLHELEHDLDENSAFKLPPRNEFIPSSFPRAPVKEEKKKAKLVLKDSYVKLWYKRDDTFKTPRNSINILMRSPNIICSARSMAMTDLFLQMVKEYLGEYSYNASLAGLSFAVDNVGAGIEWSFYGYHSKQKKFVEEVFKQTMSFVATFTDKNFATAKDNYLRELKAQTTQMPYQTANYYCDRILSERVWTFREKYAVAKTMDAKDIREGIMEILQYCRLECLMHGYIPKREAFNMLKSIKTTLNLKDMYSSELAIQRAICLPDGKSYVYKIQSAAGPESAIDVYLQTCSVDNLKSKVMTRLFAHIMQDRFFEDLRTKQQLGYVVSHSMRIKSFAVGLNFLVQSKHHPSHLHDCVEQFLSGALAVLKSLSDEEFNAYVKSLVETLNVPNNHLTDETAEYWSEIVSQRYNFDIIAENSRAILTLSKNDLLHFSETLVVPNAPNRRKMVIAVDARHASPDAKSGKDFLEGEGALTPVKDLLKFGQSMMLFPSSLP